MKNPSNSDLQKLYSLFQKLSKLWSSLPFKVVVIKIIQNLAIVTLKFDHSVYCLNQLGEIKTVYYNG